MVGVSEKSWEGGNDVIRFLLMEGLQSFGTWIEQMFLGSGPSCFPSFYVWFSPPSWKTEFAFQWLKQYPLTLQKHNREIHHVFAIIWHLPEAGWRHLMYVRDHWELMFNIDSSIFFEIKPSSELILQKAMCLVHIILVHFRNTLWKDLMLFP